MNSVSLIIYITEKKAYFLIFLNGKIYSVEDISVLKQYEKINRCVLITDISLADLEEYFNEDEEIADMFLSTKFDVCLFFIASKVYSLADVECWEMFCLESYAEEHNIEIPEFEDEEEEEEFWWGVFEEAVESRFREFGYDEAIYIQPDVCGVSYGCHLWLREVKKVRVGE